MSMDQMETFEWLRERSNRLEEVEKQLAEARQQITAAREVERALHNTIGRARELLWKWRAESEDENSGPCSLDCAAELESVLKGKSNV